MDGSSRFKAIKIRNQIVDGNKNINRLTYSGSSPFYQMNRICSFQEIHVLAEHNEQEVLPFKTSLHLRNPLIDSCSKTKYISSVIRYKKEPTKGTLIGKANVHKKLASMVTYSRIATPTAAFRIMNSFSQIPFLAVLILIPIHLCGERARPDFVQRELSYSASIFIK